MNWHFGSDLRNHCKRLRRRLFEAFGSARYSRPGLNGLDMKLVRYLSFRGGFFIEAGANDGVSQSNTYYLEKMLGWTGLLVEPEPLIAAECRLNRSQPVIEAALVERERDGSMVELHSAGLMSTVAGALGNEAATAEHVRVGREVQKLAASSVHRVPGRALSALLDEILGDQGREIDLLSLDVEGGEASALRGLDFARHAPRFICVEARDEVGVRAILDERYELAEVLTDMGSHCDLLFRRKYVP